MRLFSSLNIKEFIKDKRQTAKELVNETLGKKISYDDEYSDEDEREDK